MLSRVIRVQCQYPRFNVNAFCTSFNRSIDHFRVAMENENHNGTGNDQFKYKTRGENFLSTKQTSERSTSSFVENIEVLSPSKLLGSCSRLTEKSSEMSMDRLGQWPTESESEMSGQGLQRLRNGRFNKVSKIAD